MTLKQAKTTKVSEEAQLHGGLVRPEILILASRHDLTCDYIVSRLIAASATYLRLNSEDLSSMAVRLDPLRRELLLEWEGRAYLISHCGLRSVLFRRPVYLRDYGDQRWSVEERFSKLQWAAFIQNLILFDSARWFNHPVATYRAEHKALQLSIASQLGFAVPPTQITNAPCAEALGSEELAIKGLDTVLVRGDGCEIFGFTTFENVGRMDRGSWRSAPATIQMALANKLDIRVTVVEDRVFAVAITAGGLPVSGDWRVRRGDVQFCSVGLPAHTVERCRALVRYLGLRFGAIDLAMSDGVYYFLEVNPTGEWAWLVDAAGLPIDQAIADSLMGGVGGNVV